MPIVSSQGNPSETKKLLGLEAPQENQTEATVSASNTVTKEHRSSTLDNLSLLMERFLLDTLWHTFSKPVQIILGIVRSGYPKLAGILAIALFFVFHFIGWNFFTNIQNRVAIKSVNPPLRHKVYERNAEVDWLVNELDRLRQQNPHKEVHAIISGGPGAGKSELARQLGERIHSKENFKLNFDVSSLLPPTDVLTLNAENLHLLQSTLEKALDKVEGKKPKDEYDSDGNEKTIFTKFYQLRVALRNRSSLTSHPVVIIDNVKAPMFSFLYKRRENGRFFLNPGNDEYGEIRVIVTSQYRPATNFSSVISYMNLFDPMPTDEAVKLLNIITNIQNDNKNASYLAEALGGLPKSLADAATYIQQNRKFNSSYYFYLKELELKMETYDYNVKYAWAISVEEGSTYPLPASTAALMLIQQLIHSNDFYQDLACFIGYCGSPVISMKFLVKYIRFNEVFKDYTEFQIKTLVRMTSIYEVKTHYGTYYHNLIFTHQVTRYISLIACNERTEKVKVERSVNDLVEALIARIFHVLKTELTAKRDSSLKQMVEYTSLDFKVVDVVMSLVSKMHLQKLNLSNVITKDFCWVFLDLMAEAYLYWPNHHKSAIIMPEVDFLVNMTEQSFSEHNPEIAILLSVLYLHNTGNERPGNLVRIVDMMENFTRGSLSNADKLSIEKMALLINMIGTVYRGVAQNMAKAQEFHELALDISKRHNLKNEIAISLHLLGIIHRYQKKLDTAQKYHEEAVELGRELFSSMYSGRLGAFLLNLAVVYNRHGQLEKASIVYQEALQLTKKEYGSRDQRVGRILNTLSTNYFSLGKYNESIEALLEALSIHEEIHGDYHPNVAETLYFLGFTYRANGELQNSLQVLSRSLRIRQQYYGAQHYYIAEILHDLSNTQRELNLLDDALQNAQKCVEIFRKTLKEDSASFAASLNGLGNIYLARNDPITAKIKYENALVIFEKLHKHGSQGSSISETLKNIAIALKNLENPKEAKEYVSRALSMILKVYPEAHPRVKELRELLKELEQTDRKAMKSREEL